MTTLIKNNLGESIISPRQFSRIANLHSSRIQSFSVEKGFLLCFTFDRPLGEKEKKDLLEALTMIDDSPTQQELDDQFLSDLAKKDIKDIAQSEVFRALRIRKII